MLDDLLIPEDKRISIDLHNMELLEAEYYLNQTRATDYVFHYLYKYYQHMLFY